MIPVPQSPSTTHRQASTISTSFVRANSDSFFATGPSGDRGRKLCPPDHDADPHRQCLGVRDCQHPAVLRPDNPRERRQSDCGTALVTGTPDHQPRHFLDHGQSQALYVSQDPRLQSCFFILSKTDVATRVSLSPRTPTAQAVTLVGNIFLTIFTYVPRVPPIAVTHGLLNVLVSTHTRFIMVRSSLI